MYQALACVTVTVVGQTEVLSVHDDHLLPQGLLVL